MDKMKEMKEETAIKHYPIGSIVVFDDADVWTKVVSKLNIEAIITGVTIRLSKDYNEISYMCKDGEGEEYFLDENEIKEVYLNAIS